MRKLIGYAGMVIGGGIFVAGFFAYLIRRTDPLTHISYDGLGRTLTETPWAVRFLFGQSHEWPGWQWVLIDTVVFWCGLGIAYKLAEFGFKKITQSKI